MGRSKRMPYALRRFFLRNLIKALDGVCELLENSFAKEQSINELFGGDIKGFCSTLMQSENIKTRQEKQKIRFNRSIAKKLKNRTHVSKGVFSTKKEWRNYKKKIKNLPQEYKIVFEQIEKYIFKACCFSKDKTELLPEILELFEQSAAMKKDVLEVTGEDLAAFCDGIIAD